LSGLLSLKHRLEYKAQFAIVRNQVEPRRKEDTAQKKSLRELKAIEDKNTASTCKRFFSEREGTVDHEKLPDVGAK
jgi:hypothetical protein